MHMPVCELIAELCGKHKNDSGFSMEELLLYARDTLLGIEAAALLHTFPSSDWWLCRAQKNGEL